MSRVGDKAGRAAPGTLELVHMDCFVSLFAKIVQGEGIPSAAIDVRDTTLPGYFRPEKDWDVVIIVEGRLIARGPSIRPRNLGSVT